jgi:glycyl-tRNA synthetase beta chain
VSELLLELLSEEIPARMQRRAIDDLTGLLRGKLADAEIPAVSWRGCVTPRRLAVIAEGIPATQPDRTEDRRGPRIGAPQPAIAGFLRAAGLAGIGHCEIRDTGRGEFYFATLQHPGRPAAQVLPEVIRAAIAELPWPKSMRYPAASLRWVRPLTSVVCLLDGEVVALALDRVPVGRTTRGHRFLAPAEICVEGAADYLERLRDAHVVLDHDHRKEMIRQDLDRAAAAAGLVMKPDPGLLDEVTGLVEFPVVLMGTIDSDFMTLPPEVLATAMRAHQKYFSCLQADGTPAPRFLFVANNLASDGGKTIVAGNERVLRARLADAQFFLEQDRKVKLEDRVEALKDRVYHTKLYTVLERVKRVESLAYFLAKHVPGASDRLSQRAAHLAKADLSTGMIGEFPELQGIMGRYYALHDGEDPTVAAAIADHYRPLGPNDSVPTAPISIVVALADKIEALVAFFAIGERPTGSGDPFALRRAAQGIIRIILENKLRLPLKGAFIAASGYFNVDHLKFAAELLDFIGDRLRIHLRDKGVRHDLIGAAFAQIDADNGDLIRLLQRVEAVRAFLDTDDGANLLIAYRRASNIVAIEERRDHTRYGRDIDQTLLQQPEEFAMAKDLELASDGAERSLARGEFDAAMGHLATLRRPIDEFFNKVTVNIDEPRIRENRLCLLSRIRETMNQVADFSQIEG